MKPFVWVVAVVLAIILWLSLRSLQSRNSHRASGSNTQRADPDAYLGLRDLALQGSQVPGSTTRATEPFAVIMDWGVTNGTATVAAFADGTASIYLSSGGGYIGGGQSHESIRNSAKRMLEIASELQPAMQPTNIYPLPQRGQVTFYVRTQAGVFTASASQDDLSSHRSPFSKLGDAGQAIITEYRQIENEH